MIDDPTHSPTWPLTRSALFDVLAERYGAGIATEVARQLPADPADLGDAVDLAVVTRAIAMAGDAELALAGTAFAEHATVSAVADSADFRTAAAAAGIRSELLDIGQRLRADAAFATAWRTRRADEPQFGGRSAAMRLMTETLLRSI